MFTSSDIEFSIYEIIRQLKFFIIYLWLRSLFTTSEGKRLLYISSCFAVLTQLFFVYLQVITGTTTSGMNNEEVELNKIAGGIVRTVGTFGHPGLLAQYLNIILIAILVKALVAKGVPKKLYATIYIAGTLAVILTYSRTALAIQLATLFLTLFLFPHVEQTKNLSKKFITYLSVLVGFVAIISFNFDSILSRFENASTDSGTVRILLSKIALNMMSENPILGVGLNSFTQVMDKYDDTMMSSYWRHPVHNIYLLVASELGLIGITVFIIKLYIFFKTGIITLRRKKADEQINKEFALIGVIGLSVICLSGFLGWSWRLDAIQGLYWTLLAVIASTYKRPTARL
ncbi:O-antigen ligase family protein [Pseudomonas sp. GL-B-12]|uniref:O-antigen ligase family protein n=1 Tax=Pseudomonas sp. GL-B-12 TaxID=2832374 RepID=UPI001CBAF1FB|nr:O-antigen ligase family protein [Pseudomonas sp. GL-B-12]